MHYNNNIIHEQYTLIHYRNLRNVLQFEEGNENSFSLYPVLRTG